MAQNVQSSMYYLQRDRLYETEKVYELKYDPPEGYKKSNMLLQKCEDLLIEDIRGKEQDFSFEANGFTIMKVDCGMSVADFDDRQKIAEVYLGYIAHALQHLLGAARVQIFDYIVRKREAQFPISTGGFYQYNQPSSIVHIDTTPRQTMELISFLNDDEEASSLSQVHHQYVNIWRPLNGPVRDWPLTLCDPTTIDPIRDLQSRDLVDHENLMETFQVHRTQDQRWYYLSGQTPQEAWVFLQSDSEADGMPGVPHTSFPNPKSSEMDALRESVELRALVFYDDK